MGGGRVELGGGRSIKKKDTPGVGSPVEKAGIILYIPGGRGSRYVHTWRGGLGMYIPGGGV